MSTRWKEVTELMPEDFETHPVWEFNLEDEAGMSDTVVRPLLKLPVDTLTNRIIGARVRLANGDSLWSTMDNIDLSDPFQTEQFLGISIYSGRWIHLARYFDPWFDRESPAVLAAALNLPIDDVFPITYDIRAFCRGNPLSLTGAMECEPRKRLTDSERMKL
jgi:hypothetical protein